MKFLFFISLLSLQTAAHCTDETLTSTPEQKIGQPLRLTPRPVVVFAPVINPFSAETVYPYIQNFKRWFLKQSFTPIDHSQSCSLTTVNDPWSFWPFLDGLFLNRPLEDQTKILEQLISYLTPSTLQEDSSYPSLFLNHLKAHKFILTSTHQNLFLKHLSEHMQESHPIGLEGWLEQIWEQSDEHRNPVDFYKVLIPYRFKRRKHGYPSPSSFKDVKPYPFPLTPEEHVLLLDHFESTWNSLEKKLSMYEWTYETSTHPQILGKTRCLLSQNFLAPGTSAALLHNILKYFVRTNVSLTVPEQEQWIGKVSLLGGKENERIEMLKDLWFLCEKEEERQQIIQQLTLIVQNLILSPAIRHQALLALQERGIEVDCQEAYEEDYGQEEHFYSLLQQLFLDASPRIEVGSTPKIQVQNAHDSLVVSMMQVNLNHLKSDHLPSPSLDFPLLIEEIIGVVRAFPLEAEKMAPCASTVTEEQRDHALLALDEWKRIAFEPYGYPPMLSSELMQRVWYRVINPNRYLSLLKSEPSAAKTEVEQTKKELFNLFIQQLATMVKEDGFVCETGKVERLVQTLQVHYRDIQIPMTLQDHVYKFMFFNFLRNVEPFTILDNLKGVEILTLAQKQYQAKAIHQISLIENQTYWENIATLYSKNDERTPQEEKEWQEFKGMMVSKAQEEYSSSSLSSALEIASEFDQVLEKFKPKILVVIRESIASL